MPTTEEEIEKLAKKRVQARIGFVTHLSMYLVFNAGVLLIWALTGSTYPWFLWPMLGWGIGIVAHAITLAIGPDSPGEQRAIQREIERFRAAAR